MSTSVTWPGGGTGATATAYSIPAAGELNWSALSNFLVALGQGAQATTFQLFANRKATTTPVTVAVTDCVVGSKLAAPGAVTMNLPAGVNKQVFILFDDTGDAGTNNITINPNGADTIRGAASLVLSHNGEFVVLVYNSTDTDWKIAARGAPVGSVKMSDLPAQTVSKVAVYDGSGFLTAATTSTTQVQYLASATGTTGTTSTNVVFSTSPTLTTPDIGVATATSVNKVAITAPATSATLTLVDGTTVTGPAATGTMMTLGNTETVTGVKTFNSGTLKVNENVVLTTTATKLNYLTSATGTTGTASTNVVFSTSPTLVTPILGAATASSLTLSASGAIDWAAGNVAIGASVGANTMTFGGASSFVTVAGTWGASGFATNNSIAGPTNCKMTGVAQASYQTDVTSTSTEVLNIGKGSAANADSDVYVRFRYGASASTSGTSQGGIRSNSSHTAYEFFYSSDIRLKDDIKPWKEDALGVLESLLVRDYVWKSRPDVRVAGLVAQEAQEVIPGLVSEEEDGYLTVGYSCLYPYFIKAFQQLSDRCKKLEARIDLLEEERI